MKMCLIPYAFETLLHWTYNGCNTFIAIPLTEPKGVVEFQE